MDSVGHVGASSETVDPNVPCAKLNSRPQTKRADFEY